MKERRKTLIIRYPKIISRYESAYKKKFIGRRTSKPIIMDELKEIVINKDILETKDHKEHKEHINDKSFNKIDKENKNTSIQYQVDRYITP